MSESAKSNRAIDLSILVYCLLLFGYVLFRAFNLSLTYDEVNTMQIATSHLWPEFGQNSNNHLLNTVLIKGLNYFLEPNELMLRLPNVLAFILYLIYAVKLSKLIKPAAPYLPLVLLTAMPFLLDFFSLARGYGLAFAFVIASIYFLLKFRQESSFKNGLFSLILGMLAVLSNYSALNYFLPFLCVFMFLSFRPQQLKWKLNFIYIGLIGSFLAWVVPIMFELKENNELYYGGRKSFYHDAILSQGKTFAYHKINIAFAEILIAVIFYLSIILCIVSFVRAIKSKSIGNDTVIAALFGLACISVIAQNIIFETHFPFERTALIFFLMQVLILSFGIKDVKTRVQQIALSIFAGIFLLQTIYSLNTNHCYSWKFEAGTKEVLEKLDEINNEESGAPITLGVNYLFIPDTWYYQWKHQLHNLTFKEITECADLNLQFEEFDPRKFGSQLIFRDELSAADIESIIAYDLDYYYLHDVVVEEIKRHGYEVNTLFHADYAGSSLISFK